MALVGLKGLGIEDPLGADRKRLVTYVEIDRCATDAIGMVTGCRLGKRTLKFRDWGKMAATFVDLAADHGCVLWHLRIRENWHGNFFRRLRASASSRCERIVNCTTSSFSAWRMWRWLSPRQNCLEAGANASSARNAGRA